MNIDEQIRTCEHCEQDHNKEMDEHSQAVATVGAALLIDAPAAAAICGISRSKWYSLVSSGKTPAPVRLGRATRWNRNELTRWVAAGCPSRAKWEIMRNEK